MPIERGGRLGQQPFHRLDQGDAKSKTAAMPAQHLAQRLDSLQAAAHDHQLRGTRAFRDLRQTEPDPRAMVHGLEGQRVLRDTGHAPGRVDATQRDDQGVEGQRTPPPLGGYSSRPGVDPGDPVADEAVTGPSQRRRAALRARLLR
jgi:hypothetical protein